MELSFLFSCLTLELFLHSVVLNVGTVRDVLGYGESMRKNAGTYSYCISTLFWCLVATGTERILTKRVSRLVCKAEVLQTHPSATEPGQPTHKSMNRFQ